MGDGASQGETGSIDPPRVARERRVYLMSTYCIPTWKEVYRDYRSSFFLQYWGFTLSHSTSPIFVKGFSR
jgi:hypothetical protein